MPTLLAQVFIEDARRVVDCIWPLTSTDRRYPGTMALLRAGRRRCRRGASAAAAPPGGTLAARRQHLFPHFLAAVVRGCRQWRRWLPPPHLPVGAPQARGCGHRAWWSRPATGNVQGRAWREVQAAAPFAAAPAPTTKIPRASRNEPNWNALPLAGAAH